MNHTPELAKTGTYPLNSSPAAGVEVAAPLRGLSASLLISSMQMEPKLGEETLFLLQPLLQLSTFQLLPSARNNWKLGGGHHKLTKALTYITPGKGQAEPPDFREELLPTLF